MSTTTETVELSQLVSVRGRFVRSVHIERDYYQPSGNGYQLTQCAVSVLEALQTAFDKPAERALTIVGPYGAGKSAFCVHIARLFANQPDKGKDDRPLPASDDVLSLLATHNLVPILIVGSRQPLAESLLHGMATALSKVAGADTLAQGFVCKATELAAHNPSPQQVANLYAELAKVAVQIGYDGILLIVDEMGKFLEHAALRPKDSDIFVLQELGETAARSGDNRLIVLGVLHQTPDAYAQKLSRTQQTEWVKVSERFRQLTFFPSDTERITIVSQVLKHEPGITLNDHFYTLAQQCEELELLPRGLYGQFIEVARKSYPLHPLALLALPVLFRRAGQSHRSMFTFLAGEEPHSLGRFLASEKFAYDAPPLYTLDALFDYAADVLMASWGQSAVARTWADAIESIQHAGELSLLANRVLKCIALLAMLHDQRLRATPEVIQLALTTASQEQVDINAAIAELEAARLIVFRRFQGVYRVWEGGDVDIEAEMEIARKTLPTGVTLHVATNLCPPANLVARRHSYETGTLRIVQVQPCAYPQLADMIRNTEGELTVLFCLCATTEEITAVEGVAQQITERKDLLIATALETDILRETASAITATHHVEKHCTKLQSDRAARRELAARRAEAEAAFKAEWERVFSVAEGGANWYYQGGMKNIGTPRRFSELLSVMADESYWASPKLRNELINRHMLSSATAAGRRSLIEAMLSQGEQEYLGITGYPPERSMYECILRASGLHQYNDVKGWYFASLSEEDPNRLCHCMNALNQMIYSGNPEPRPLTSIYNELKKQPYGLTDGVLPVIFCAFMQSNSGTATLYREGTFLPDPGISNYEVLLRRPDLFSVVGCKISGERLAIIERLAHGLHCEPELVPVVKGLIRRVRSLPDFAWKTKRLPKAALGLRGVFQKSASPEKLLFVEIPIALGVNIEASNIDSENVSRFFVELNNALKSLETATDSVVNESRDILLAACGYPPGHPGWCDLKEDAKKLTIKIVHPRLVPFIERLQMKGDERSVGESVLAYVANRPPRTWTDAEADQFAGQALEIGDLFKKALYGDDNIDSQLSLQQLTVEERKHCEKAAIDIVADLKSKSLSSTMIKAALLIAIGDLDADDSGRVS